PPPSPLFPYTTLFRSAERGQGFGRALECRHDAVGLRRPGIGCERDPHALTLQHLGEHGKACIVFARYIDESTPGALPREERPHRSEEHTSELQSLRHL